ncbi:abortive infection protein [Amylibacter marinus]|uniref:Abortive infection protein n=1 Tax=Amylibacter marinus TaxID=1475483 RepID=A0ABQ5VWQ0_9RHOB|nr:CPBP family intramembrane glutamic endopeptidase [Amylibacter marinus]GLQ35569.1 abortive infection protein [Amylibacter marinus]
MTQNFQNFIAPAQARNQLWRILAVLVLWLMGYLALAFGIGLLGVVFFGGEVEQSFATGVFDRPASMLVVLTTFVGWVLALVGAVYALHRRGLFSMLGGGARAFGIFFIIAVIGFVLLVFIMGLVFPERYDIVENLTLSIWYKSLFIGVILMLIQVSAEELLFRGYLMQQLAVRFRSRWVYMVLPSVLFGLGHFSTTGGAYLGFLIVASTALLGLFLADLTYRTGNLGAAIGVHFANNFFAMFWVTYQQEMSGLARYTVPHYADNPQDLVQILEPALISQIVLFALYWLVMERRAQRIAIPAQQP